ncbi:hypothetical protein SORBI_3004G047900 [Sorghum bicolor]|uniref:CBS domain-containing protein n=1 Tax=Sorghum bicolor TaxID=4558 RepID=A0A1Z5RKZ8_SORBI|nr:hypothetical protein SORBI_3004G047900 [Sorghum bicolor]
MAQLRAPADEERLQQEAPHGVAGGGDVSSNKKARAGLCGVLRERKVVELARAKRRLVEVPYTATLAHTANALLAARVSGVAVAAPPGHWIGAGGSMILESDPATGAVRKHYIGMVNMLDILAHIAEASDDAEADGESVDLDRRMAVPVSSVIGHSLEGLTLWTLHPTTSVLDCMETFSKGVHRALVPLESSADNVVAVELVESAPGYRMLTQMDVARFLRAHGAELRDVLSRTVRELGAVNDTVFAVAGGTKVIDAIRAMRAASLTAVPVVDHATAAAVGSGTETLQYVSPARTSDDPNMPATTPCIWERAKGDRDVLGDGPARLPGGAAAAVAGDQRDGVQEEGGGVPGEHQARGARRRRHGHRHPGRRHPRGRRRRGRRAERRAAGGGGGAGGAGDVLPGEHPRRGDRGGGIEARAPAVGGRRGRAPSRRRVAHRHPPGGAGRRARRGPGAAQHRVVSRDS